MNNTFYTTGSLGDTYIACCKLYGYKNPQIIHYTRHHFWYPMIRDIYSLIDANVEFSNKKKANISCLFSTLNKEADKIKLCRFPKFKKLEEPYKKFDLPKKYIVICPKTGRRDQPERTISTNIINNIVTNSNIPIVIIGIDKSIKIKSGINLIGKTTILEALSICSHANEVHSYHGLFGFFPPSQRIKTYFYEKNPTLMKSIEARLLPEWKEYIEIIKI